jgi:TatD DNase family protein
VTSEELPALDCHAHIAPDVTPPQLDALGDVVVFAVTRSLDEAERVSRRADPRLVWGCGVHPAVAEALSAFDERRFRRLLSRFALVGEVGMDRRAGGLDQQAAVLRSIMRAVADEPVLLSLHSAGCADKLVDVLAERPHPGAILHWFLGDDDSLRRAVDFGCFFSVNGSMSEETLSRIPADRMLPETDFPATKRRGGGRAPGAVKDLEERVASVLGETRESVRRRWYRNLRSIATASKALDRLPENLFNLLLAA